MRNDWTDRVRQLMTDQKKTQEDLRVVFGVRTRGAVGHYLTGRRTPSPTQLVDLSKELGCSLDWLLKGELRVNEPSAAYIVEKKGDLPQYERLLQTYRFLEQEGMADAGLRLLEHLATELRRHKRIAATHQKKTN